MVYVHVCICVCVCVRERERERDTQSQTHTYTERQVERNKVHPNTEFMSLLLSCNYGKTGDMIYIGSMIYTANHQLVFVGVDVTPEFLL